MSDEAFHRMEMDIEELTTERDALLHVLTGKWDIEDLRICQKLVSESTQGAKCEWCISTCPSPGKTGKIAGCSCTCHSPPTHDTKEEGSQ